MLRFDNDNWDGVPTNFTGIVILPNGNQWWLRDGKTHRMDGFVYDNGTREWLLNGRLHRLDGPAFIGSNGTKMWYRYGALYRTDGPAVEWANGNKWYYVFTPLTEKQFEIFRALWENTLLEKTDELAKTFVTMAIKG